MADNPDQPQASPRARAGLDELQARLEELHRSVEELGDEGTWTAPPQPEPAVAAPDYSAPPAPAPGGGLADPVPPGPPAFTDTGAEPPPPSRAAEPEPIPVEPEPSQEVYTEQVAAPSAPSGTIAHLDAGPFIDLVDLRHFEDQLITLESVNDVKVRRISQGRAQIELGMAGPYPLARELQRLDQGLRVEPGPEGQVVVDIPARVVVEEEPSYAEEAPVSAYARGDV